MSRTGSAAFAPGNVNPPTPLPVDDGWGPTSLEPLFPTINENDGLVLLLSWKFPRVHDNKMN